MSGIAIFFISFLLRQRAQLTKLQEQLVQEKRDREGEVKTSEQLTESNQPMEKEKRLNYDDFSENLGIIKDLQSKLDGMAIELKIRGEMIVERDNKIGQLEKKIYEFDTQISIFKGQIAPALEQTITDLRAQEDKLQKTIEQQKLEIEDKNERIQASQNILKKAGLGELLELEEYQVTINKKDVILNQQLEEMENLQEQVDQLPVICLRMTEEIKSRESEIHSLKVYNKVLNKKLIDVQQNLSHTNESDTTITDLSRKIIEIQDQLQEEKNRTALLDKEILLLNGLVTEKESKIEKLEEKLQNILFK